MPESKLTEEFVLRGDYVTLGQLLKLTGIIGSGGEARLYLSQHGVLVNGAREERRGRKLRSGDQVEIAGHNVIQISEPSD